MLLDVNEVASGLVPMLSRLIGETIEIAMLAGDELPPVLADRAQLEQVVINLAINARDAMPDGGTLAIETGAAGEHVRLAVSDTGTGIEPGVLEHIFEPFYTTKDVGLGTGLGLATVHGIVTQSGGRVEVSSDPGLGSTFTVLLPAAEGAPREPERAGPLAVGGDETLLLCEDEDGVRKLLELVLTGAGYTVLSAAGAEQALALAAEPRDRRAGDRHRDARHVRPAARRPARAAARAVHLRLLVRGRGRAARGQRVPGEAVRPRRAAGRSPRPARSARA